MLGLSSTTSREKYEAQAVPVLRVIGIEANRFAEASFRVRQVSILAGRNSPIVPGPRFVRRNFQQITACFVDFSKSTKSDELPNIFERYAKRR
ncbi:MAG TPA: hypothetical protein VGI40_08105, partial [Pirellulaceae bacterium]